MGGGGSDGDSENTLRYAEYFEAAHKNILNNFGVDVITKSVFAAINEAFGQSPYSEHQVISPDDAFFGSGYSVTDFPSLYDMFGKFMAGVDVHNLWEQTYNGLFASPTVNTAIDSHAALLADDITQNIYPRFEAGMRDIGAVNSSAFAVGRALIEDSRIKSINEYSAKLQLGLLETSSRMWGEHLNWNKNVIAVYYELVNAYHSSLRDANAQNLEMRHRDVLFDLSLYEYGRAMLGVISGAQGTVQPEGPSQLEKSASGALGGAAAGYQATGTWQGAAVGGVIGLAASFF